MRFVEESACNQYLTFYCDGVEAISPAKQTPMKTITHTLVNGPVEYAFTLRRTYKQDFAAMRSFKFQSMVHSFGERSKHTQEPSFSQMRDFFSAASMFAESHLSSH